MGTLKELHGLVKKGVADEKAIRLLAKILADELEKAHGRPFRIQIDHDCMLVSICGSLNEAPITQLRQAV